VRFTEIFSPATIISASMRMSERKRLAHGLIRSSTQAFGPLKNSCAGRLRISAGCTFRISRPAALQVAMRPPH
jgi:hypothetical protein